MRFVPDASSSGAAAGSGALLKGARVPHTGETECLALGATGWCTETPGASSKAVVAPTSANIVLQ
jgi:hypothetical protein